MNNLMDLFYFAGDRVDYVVVRNPAKVRTDFFKGSSLEAELGSSEQVSHSPHDYTDHVASHEAGRSAGGTGAELRGWLIPNPNIWN